MVEIHIMGALEWGSEQGWHRKSQLEGRTPNLQDWGASLCKKHRGQRFFLEPEWGGAGAERGWVPYVPLMARTLATRSWKPCAQRLGTSSSTISILRPLKAGLSNRCSLWSGPSWG